jgi:hypothetical protein
MGLLRLLLVRFLLPGRQHHSVTSPGLITMESKSICRRLYELCSVRWDHLCTSYCWTSQRLGLHASYYQEQRHSRARDGIAGIDSIRLLHSYRQYCCMYWIPTWLELGSYCHYWIHITRRSSCVLGCDCHHLCCKSQALPLFFKFLSTL